MNFRSIFYFLALTVGLSLSFELGHRFKRCAGCGTIISGAPYTEGFVQGIIDIHDNGDCSVTITCAKVDPSDDSIVSLSVQLKNEATIANGALALGDQSVAITVLCDGEGSFYFADFPTYPLNGTVYCESTPAPPTTLKPATTAAPEPCSHCGSIISGAPYTEGMVQGIIDIQDNADCSKTITCTKVDPSNESIISLSVQLKNEATIANGALALGDQSVSITVFCGSDGSFYFADFPTYPLNGTVYCESTPAAAK